MKKTKEDIAMKVGYKTKEEKEAQLSELYDKLYYIFEKEGVEKDIQAENTGELIDVLNRIDLVDYLNLKEGYGYECMKPCCHSKLTNANFYKVNGIWMYKCFACMDEKPIAQSKLILDIIKYYHPNRTHQEVIEMIREMLYVDYTDEYYQMVKGIIYHNLEIIQNLDKESYLYKLISKRKLDDFYNCFLEMARIYTMRQQNGGEKIAFYASREFMKRYMEVVFNQKANNSILQKIDVLNALGFLSKVEVDDMDERVMNTLIRYNAKERNRQIDKKNFLKQVGCFTVTKMSSEALQDAERVAKIIIDNKINIFTQAHLELIRKPVELSEEDLEIVEGIKIIINQLMTSNYLTYSELKESIEFDIKKDIRDKVLEDLNLMFVKGTKKNIEKYKIKDDNIDRETLLIVRKEKTDIEKYIEIASDNLNKELDKKGYVLNRNLNKVMNKGNKFYKIENGKKVLVTGKGKELLVKNNIGKIMIINNLVNIKCNKKNVEDYNIKEKCKCQESFLVRK